MAIFHLSARPPIARASGRSATAAAAYRAGALITDQRTGQVFDYRRRKGVLDARIHLPGGRLVYDRDRFWNDLELHHRRRDAVLAREVVLALPNELDADERAALAFSFSKEIAQEFGVGVDCALHAPSRDGDDRNFHAHLLLTACTVDADGGLGKKAERLDPIACKRSGAADSVSWLRPRWQLSVNAALARKGSAERVDHRSFKDRGIERLPAVHIGIKGASARGRASLNERLRQRNARLEALDEQTGKLMRMKARLAARIEPKPDDQRPVHVVDDPASDLLLWRRRPQPKMPKGAVSARLAKPEGLEAGPQSGVPWNGPRPARRRPGR
ncbi:MobA/MobL family protein [Acidovorax sp. HDW3]|uniref:MobA/MobL family protein n=1 Tax=Acidovorax sp. HDW3 TaxID=2714923 RepID=UPI001408E1C0|nr:MobA/MobL family protein [Acidovorax sp. HDW3]QIL43887.1 MobA/MobL family protein [Acidovorax sp. HDW3]